MRTRYPCRPKRHIASRTCAYQDRRSPRAAAGGNLSGRAPMQLSYLLATLLQRSLDVSHGSKLCTSACKVAASQRHCGCAVLQGGISAARRPLWVHKRAAIGRSRAVSIALALPLTSGAHRNLRLQMPGRRTFDAKKGWGRQSTGDVHLASGRGQRTA